MLVYRHPEHKHVQNVFANETVRRKVLERSGWVLDVPVKDTEAPAIDDVPVKRNKAKK